MASGKNSKSRPITDALKREGLNLDEHESLDPSRLLAELVDLRGSVVLAQYIAGEQERPHAQPSHPQAILALTAKTIEDVRSRLDFAQSNAFRPRFRLPTAQRAWNVIQRTGINAPETLKTKKERKAALRSATRMTWGPFGEFLEVQLKRSRFALKELREELTGPLTGLGTEVSAIERMDAALRQSIDSEVSRLYQRVGIHCERRYSIALQKALDELPVTAPKEAFAIGFSETGWLGAIFQDGLDLVRAIIENEIQALENLIGHALSIHRDTQ